MSLSVFVRASSVSGSRTSSMKYGDLDCAASTRPAQCRSVRIGLEERFKPRRPADFILREDVGRIFDVRTNNRFSHIKLPILQLPRRQPVRRQRRSSALSPLITLIWNERNATICESVTIPVVDQPASNRL